MISHSEIQKRLSAYSGGDLDDIEAGKIVQHLAVCPDCRSELADLQTSMRLIRNIPEVDPPYWLTSRIMTRLREEQSEKRSWLHRLFFPLHLKLPIEIMALLVVCISGYYLSQTVETTMKQPAQHRLQDVPAEQQTPVISQPNAKESVAEQKTEISESRPDKAHSQASPVAAPAYAPESPALKSEEKVIPKNSMNDSIAPAQKSESSGYAVESLSAARKSIQRSEQRNADIIQPAPSALGPSKAAKSIQLPTANVRLQIFEPASAKETIKLAVVSSGGTHLPNSFKIPNEKQITINIQASRFPELMSRLEKLGKIVKQPSLKDISGIIEVVITW